MNPEKIIIVCAGNYDQYNDWLHLNFKDEETKRKYRYCGNGMDLMKMAGLIVEKVEVIGTFWERENAGEYYKYAQSRIR